MLPRRAQDTVDARRPRLVAEQRGHDERMRKAHLAPVHDAVARALDHREEVVVRRAGISAVIGFEGLLHDKLLDCAGHDGWSLESVIDGEMKAESKTESRIDRWSVVGRSADCTKEHFFEVTGVAAT